MYSESFMPPTVHANLQDVFWMNALFADRGGFMSAHQMPEQMLPVFDVSHSSIWPQRVDPFDHPACRVLLGGVQLGFDAFSEYGSCPAVAKPLAGAIAFGIGFAQRYSRDGRAGEALFESGVSTVISCLNPLPLPIRVMTNMFGSFAVYTKNQCINKDSFNFTTAFFSERLIEAAGGNPDLALLYYSDYGDARLESLGVIQGYAFTHEFPDWLAQKTFLLFGNTTETLPSQRSAVPDNAFLNLNSMSLPSLSFTPCAHRHWYPAMAPTSVGMPFFTNAGKQDLWLLTEDQSLIVVRQEDLNRPTSSPLSIALPRLSSHYRLFTQKGFLDKLGESLTYTGRNYNINGVPKVRLDNSNQIVIGVEILLGLGKLTFNPFIIIGAQAIALGIYATTKIVKNKRQKKLIWKINDRTQDLKKFIDKMDALSQGIESLIEENDFTAAVRDIKKWCHFRPEAIKKIKKLQGKYQKLSKQKNHETECDKRINDLDQLKFSLYEKDAQRQAIVSISQSQVPALNAELKSLTGKLNHMICEFERHFENRDHVSLDEIDAKVKTLKSDLEEDIKKLQDQYQTLQDKTTSQAERECFSKNLQSIKDQLISVNQCTQQISYLTDHLVLEKQLFAGLALSCLAEVLLHTVGYQENWVSDALKLANVFLINEINFRRNLVATKDDIPNDSRFSQLTLLQDLQVAAALTKLLLHFRGHQVRWVDDILGMTSILIQSDKKIQIEHIKKTIKNFVSHPCILNASLCLSELKDLPSMGIECFGGLKPLHKLYVSNFLLNLADMIGWERTEFAVRSCQIITQSAISALLIDHLVHDEKRTMVDAHGASQSLMSLFMLGLKTYAEKYQVNLLSNDPYRLFNDTKAATAILFCEHYQQQQSWLSRLLRSYSSIDMICNSIRPIFPKNSAIARLLSEKKIPVLNELISFFGMMQMGFHIGTATFDTYKIREIESLMDKGKSTKAFLLIEEALSRSPNNKLIQSVKDFYTLQEQIFHLELGMYFLSNGIDFLFDQANARRASQALLVVSQIMQQHHLYSLQILKRGYKNQNQFSLQQLYSRKNLQQTWAEMGRIEKARNFIQIAISLVMISIDESKLTSRNRMHLRGVSCLYNVVNILLIRGHFYTELTSSDLIRMFLGLSHSIFSFYRSYWNDYYEQHPNEVYKPFSFSYRKAEMLILSILSHPFYRGAFYLSGLSSIVNRFGRAVPWIAELRANDFLKNTLPYLTSSMNYLAAAKIGVDVINNYRITSRYDELEKIETLMRKGAFDHARQLLDNLKDPWEKYANRIFNWVFGADWSEENIKRLYLVNFIRLHDGLVTENDLNLFDTFLSKIESSSLALNEKLKHTESLLHDIAGYQFRVSHKHGELFLKHLNSLLKGKTDSHDRVNLYYQEGLLYLKVFQDLTKSRKFISSLSENTSDNKKINSLNHQLTIANLRHSMFLLDNSMRLLRCVIRLRPPLLASVRESEPAIIHLAMLIQEVNLNQHMKMQQQIHLKNQLLFKGHSDRDRDGIQKEIRDLSTWTSRVAKGDLGFIFRSVNISLLLVGDITERRWTHASQSKKILDHALMLSELSLWLLQCSHHYRKCIESEGYMEGLISPDTFYTVSQTLSMFNRAFSLMQKYYDPDVLNTRFFSILNSVSNHFYSDYGCKIYSYYLTHQGWVNLYPDWRLLSHMGHSLDPVLDSMRKAKNSLVRVLPTLPDFHRWLLPVAYVFFLGRKIYQKCQLDFQCSLATNLLNDGQFNDAYDILSSVEVDSLFLKRMKVIAALYKQPSEPGQMQEFIHFLSEKLSNQPETNVLYLRLIAEFSMRLSQQPGNIALYERLDYLRQALHYSKNLLAENPDKQDNQLFHIKLAYQMIFLATQSEEEEEDIEDIDPHQFLTDALEQVEPFLAPDHSIEVQYQANLVTGNVYYLRQQKTEREDFISLQDCDAAMKHLATAWRQAEENPNLADKMPDEQATQLLRQLAILACKQHNWSTALLYYEKIKHYPISNEMKGEIENYQQALRQQIEIESVRRSMPAWQSMNMFSAASARARSVIVEEIDESREEHHNHTM